MGDTAPWQQESEYDLATSQFETWLYKLKQDPNNFAEENRYESFKILKEISDRLKNHALSKNDSEKLRNTIRASFPIEYKNCVAGLDVFTAMEKIHRENEWYQMAKHNGVRLAQLAASCAVRSRLYEETHAVVFQGIAEKLRLGLTMQEQDSEELYKKFCDYYKYTDNFMEIKNFFEEKSGASL